MDTGNVVCNNYEYTHSIVNLSGWLVIHKVATGTLTMTSAVAWAQIAMNAETSIIDMKRHPVM